ncbi:UNVERIFIED_CONTAM: hypothetical protein Sangu_0207800 [Sesamum angustifolium]|uniref:RING-CH-type domain-containing protein n=1 Tax=Sesamum angustifolium TaxID=2727405 RepID=A0AAW2RMR8_9LAMI
MGDHFVLLVDRLLTESALEAAIQSKIRLQNASPSVSKHMTNGFSFDRMDLNLGSSPGKLAECKICHDEDEDSNMEIPCSCRGSLKYAHRKCVQRWCNEKGDTICEICHQVAAVQARLYSTTSFVSLWWCPMNFRSPPFSTYQLQTKRMDYHNINSIHISFTFHNCLICFIPGCYDTIDNSTQRRYHDCKIGILARVTASDPCMLHHLAWHKRNALFWEPDQEV